MAMIPKMGTRVSPGVYRNPKGNIYNSATGQLPNQGNQSMIPKMSNGVTVQKPNAPYRLSEGDRSLKDPRAQQIISTLSGRTPIGPKDKLRLAALQKRYPGQPAPAAATPAPTVEAPVVNQPGAVPPVSPTEATPQDPQFKSTYDFMPKDMNEDPIYQDQLHRGSQRINRLLASRGLLGSNADAEQNTDLERGLRADFYQRNLDTARNDAGRYDQTNQFASDYKANREDQQFDRLYKGTSLALDQNPMKYASAGTDAYSDITGALGTKVGNYLRDAYGRARGGGGGGGGGPFIPPNPSGPDYSSINAAEGLGGTAGNQDWLNTLISGASRFF